MFKHSAKLLINDKIESIIKIKKYTNGLTYTVFTDFDLLIECKYNNYTIIGEAANRLPKENTAVNTHVDWKNNISFRNRSVDENFGSDSLITC